LPHIVRVNRSFALTALTGLALLAPACSKPLEDVEGPRHVFLISIDTLRADRCSVYGYDRPTTPFLEELAARGALFENHMVNSNNTLTSHASIMTGLVPLAHDTYDHGDLGRQPLSESFQTIAEIMKAAGFATAAFTTHKAWLDRNFGVLQGFDVVDSEYRGAVANWKTFLRWFDAERPPRVFAFLHFYDPHSEGGDDAKPPTYPYESTDELVAEFAGKRPADFTGCLKSIPATICNSKWLRAVTSGKEDLSEEHARFLSGLYDAGVRKMDDDLRLFFEQLERRGVLDDALVVVTSDHGEDLYEHRTLLHGTYFDEVMHVPLIVVPPEDMPVARSRIEEVTRSIDIAPTILDFLGLHRIGQGQSLLPAIYGTGPVEDSETFFMPAVLRAEDERGLFKMYSLPKGPVFYDLEEDPQETRNVFEDPELLARNEERIARAEARIKELRDKAYRVRNVLKKDQGTVQVTPEVAAGLEELGYMGSADDDDDE